MVPITSNNVRPRSESTYGISNSTPPTSAEEVRLGPSRAHFSKKYYEIKPLATGSDGETYLAISRKAADKLCDELLGSFQSSAHFFNALRKHVVVAKFPKKGRGTDALANEINFLAKVLPFNKDQKCHVPVSQLLDHHVGEESMWLTLEFAKGGDLNGFVKDSNADLSLGMRWHIGLQLAEAIACLHLGVTDLSSASENAVGAWPLVCHSDFHTGNLLLTSSEEGSYRDYPDISLSDFGAAKHYKTRAQTSAALMSQNATGYAGESLKTFKQRQLQDFHVEGMIMESLCLISRWPRPLCAFGNHCRSNCGQCPRADCENCLAMGKRHCELSDLNCNEKLYLEQAQEFRNFQGAQAEHTRAEALAFLTTFVDVAREQRERFYQPLFPATKARLDLEKLSDEEFDKALGLGLLDDEEL